MPGPKTGIENRFQSVVFNKKLWTRDDRLLVAVSGGVDSMVLLRLLLNSGHPYFEAAHVNYGLRGEASDEDEYLVASVCKYEQLKLHKMRVPASVWSGKGSIQMVAREVRYEWFESLLKEQKLDLLITAHHANDNFETALYNLTKGTGISGLRGMVEKAGNRIRPLLSFQKRELKGYAEKQGLRWREDETNRKNDYARNKIRNTIVPILEEINPNLAGTFRHAQKRFLGLEQLLREELNRLRDSYLIREGGRHKLDISWYKGDDASQLLLSELLRGYGVAAEMFEQLAKTIKKGHSGKLFFTRSYQLNFDRGLLIIQPLESMSSSQEVVANSSGVYQINADDSIEITEENKAVIDEDSSKAVLDASKIDFPIVFRPWKEGDSFQPLGMKGRKKLSDFLIDQKVSLSAKEKIYVALSNDVICWVVGMRIDHRFRIQSHASKAVALHFHSNN